jgi:hypothetical protein
LQASSLQTPSRFIGSPAARINHNFGGSALAAAQTARILIELVVVVVSPRP